MLAFFLELLTTRARQGSPLKVGQLVSCLGVLMTTEGLVSFSDCLRVVTLASARLIFRILDEDSAPGESCDCGATAPFKDGRPRFFFRPAEAGVIGDSFSATTAEASFGEGRPRFRFAEVDSDFRSCE